jgi:hypothetical protein
MDGEEKFRKLLSDIDNNIDQINSKDKNLKKVRKGFTELKNMIESYIGQSGGYIKNTKNKRRKKYKTKKTQRFSKIINI